MNRRLAAILAADISGYSRLMGEDEPGTLLAVQAVKSKVIDPVITRHYGRVVKLMGDGILVEFASVVEATQSAAEIQRELAGRNRGVAGKRRIEMRIGVHLGDIMIEHDDVFGDGVNIAARLEGMAPIGGVCLSRQAYDQVEGKLALKFRSLGQQTLKNIIRPVEVFLIEPDDLEAAAIDPALLKQEISYCRTPDHVRLAWATVGQGPPLMRTGNWLTHIEYDWANPVRRAVLQSLARHHTLIRYDARGNGLSDWDVASISLEDWIRDLETVVDVAGLKRFPLLAISQGCAVAIAYAVRHRERVSRLVLYGGFARGGNKRSPKDREQRKAMTTLMGIGWGTDDPGFRQLFTSLMMPGATKEQADALNVLQRLTTSPECAVRYYETVNNFDVEHLLPQVKAPTLVMHVRGDLMEPIDEGRKLAAKIPGAHFIALEGRNHSLLPGEPAQLRFLEELELFLQE
jgi:class 3 adenylate cyclase/pimeloyl-ACP methyl ester carboxylesterase